MTHSWDVMPSIRLAKDVERVRLVLGESLVKLLQEGWGKGTHCRNNQREVTPPASYFGSGESKQETPKPFLAKKD